MIDPAAKTILVVDDKESVRSSLEKILKREGYQVLLAEDGLKALDIVRAEPVNLILTDLMMPGLSGNELLKAAKKAIPEIEVVVITGFGTVETAKEAIKGGAYDFIEKPLQRTTVTKVIQKALENQALILENRDLKERLKGVYRYEHIIGSSRAMRSMMEMVEQVASSSATILLLGESGTGKGLISQAIHHFSPRRDRPFIKVSCAALPETLLEAELFGYEKGAFTGAIGRKEGRFDLADGGTLFFDEIGEMTLSTQVKLLRVLQEGEFERLGGTKTMKVDIRIVAATNADLAKAVQEKRFREDLYYRLNVITITLPTLRERKEDIPLLVDHFLTIYRKKNNKQIKGISRETLDALIDYSWPGNVRELENTMERAVVLTRDEMITLGDLPQAIRKTSQPNRHLIIPMGTPLAEIERMVIEETLKDVEGDKAAAARKLGIASRTIYRKIDREKREAESFMEFAEDEEEN
ncbi:MAG: sigma-54-dependent Fis family transcriptional regulator [Candidatus Tectomicrobia bacterium]|nr:sigma-54-dependent Fis family transcriptional regulator [Candidatus Tectomicrobia bacterium]